MLAKFYSAAVYGVDAYEIEVEVNDGRGDVAVVVVGLPDTAVKESKDRVTTAVANSGFSWPRGRTTINLAAGGYKKGRAQLRSADRSRNGGNFRRGRHLVV
jgi:magnesium chelatase family protein